MKYAVAGAGPLVLASVTLAGKKNNEDNDVATWIEIEDPRYECEILADNVTEPRDLAVDPVDERVFFVQQGVNWAICELINGKGEPRFETRYKSRRYMYDMYRSQERAKRDPDFWEKFRKYREYWSKRSFSAQIEINARNEIFICEVTKPSGPDEAEKNVLELDIRVYDMKTNKLKLKRRLEHCPLNSSGVKMSANRASNDFYFVLGRGRYWCVDTNTGKCGKWRTVQDYYHVNVTWGKWEAKNVKVQSSIPFYGICCDSDNNVYEVWHNHVTKIGLSDQKSQEIFFQADLYDIQERGYNLIEHVTLDPVSKKIVLVEALASNFEEFKDIYALERETVASQKAGWYITQIPLQTGKKPHIAGPISHIAKLDWEQYFISGLDVDSKRNIYIYSSLFSQG